MKFSEWSTEKMAENQNRQAFVADYITKRKRDLEMEMGVLEELERLIKRPRRDLNIQRPTRTVSPIPERLWQNASNGISELMSEVAQYQTESDDLFVQAENAIAAALANIRQYVCSVSEQCTDEPHRRPPGQANAPIIGNIIPPHMMVPGPVAVLRQALPLRQQQQQSSDQLYGREINLL